ncbi:imelysin family protein [Rhodohalobacter mucosus]|uniref:Peptidase M75 superfamily protein n=1 Tax=Rhodohalobacter mucosus TaxID=2079485 RepID=A0A316TZ77_9BACT|nr:imelysin family protein [Rhodohalobacter mucosus]PWN05316.1 peptidase M75 superfamily protein [Rhodohalobacter mucosus]
MKRYSILTLLIFSTAVLMHGCTDDGPLGPDPDDFDRSAILTNWADNLIVPAYQNFVADAEALESAAADFSANPAADELLALRNAFETAYLSFQKVSMYEIGPAMQVGAQGINLRNYLNSYPSDTAQIVENVSLNDINLDLPSQLDAQGFPALDYLLYGAAGSEAEILALYSEGADAPLYRSYLQTLSARIAGLAGNVLNAWETGYRDEFTDNSGNGANASIDMMVNDYIFYYEKWLRAGKVGIPAGVFSGTPLPTHVEALYHGSFSRQLALEALSAVQDFFNGNHVNGTGSGESLNSYLDYLDSRRDGSQLSVLINSQFESARSELESLQQNFADQVENDNIRMLNAYDELQKNVVFMKVDMLQALNISVDYVDADGD